MTRHRITILWLALNGLAIAAYLRMASLAWVEPALADMPEAHGGGAAMVWALGAVPVFLVCALLNLAMLAWLARGEAANGGQRTGRLAWAISVLWLGACAVDFSRH